MIKAPSKPAPAIHVTRAREQCKARVLRKLTSLLLRRFNVAARPAALKTHQSRLIAGKTQTTGFRTPKPDSVRTPANACAISVGLLLRHPARSVGLTWIEPSTDRLDRSRIKVARAPNDHRHPISVRRMAGSRSTIRKLWPTGLEDLTMPKAG